MSANPGDPSSAPAVFPPFGPGFSRPAVAPQRTADASGAAVPPVMPPFGAPSSRAGTSPAPAFTPAPPFAPAASPRAEPAPAADSPDETPAPSAAAGIAHAADAPDETASATTAQGIDAAADDADVSPHSFSAEPMPWEFDGPGAAEDAAAEPEAAEAEADDEDLPWLELPAAREPQSAAEPFAVDDPASTAEPADAMPWDSDVPAGPVATEEDDEAVLVDDEVVGVEDLGDSTSQTGLSDHFAAAADAESEDGIQPAEGLVPAGDFGMVDARGNDASAEQHSAPASGDNPNAAAFAEVAERLEGIARALRERPGELLAGGSGDALELLVTGFVLGYTQRAGR
jgi:hypothetical protein